jgi:signal transduction histidine kinase
MILIVDDRPENILPLKKILELNGLECESALSGEEALRKILKKEYALIILDVQMPGMDGFEVAESIGGFSKSRDIPIIFLSAVSKDKKFVTQGYTSGGIDYLTKPVDPEILILKVRTFLKLSEQQSTLRKMHRELEREVEERRIAQQELARLNSSLEEMVKQRTAQLFTKNKQLEAMNLELQQFTWVVSHDLKEPIRKIQTFNNLLAERYLQPFPEARNYIERSVLAAKRMQILIEDLLHYSRLSVENFFEPTDLTEIVSQVKSDFSELLAEKKARVQCGKLIELDMIPGQMRQVFQNLFSNSLKFAREGQTPQIAVTAERVKELSFNSEPDEAGFFCRIKFTDNGIGFDAQFLDRIFVIFQRLHSNQNYEGTGIGLAIVKKIIENHNGIITANSIENEGTSFVMVLPLKHEKKENDAKNSEPAAFTG